MFHEELCILLHNVLKSKNKLVRGTGNASSYMTKMGTLEMAYQIKSWSRQK